MTDQIEQKEAEDKRVLRLDRPGRLELKKTEKVGQVRQSFSHGRSKAVTVEVRRKRTFTQTADGDMAEVKKGALGAESREASTAAARAAAEAAVAQFDEVSKAARRSLTDQERAARARALQVLREVESEAAERAAELEEERALEPAAAELERAAQERLRAELGLEGPATVDEAAPRIDEATKAETASPTAEILEQIGADTKPKTKLKLVEAPAEEEDESETARGRRPGKVEVRKPVAPTKRAEPRRRTGKITVTQALYDEERVRSLASVRRARERERRAQMKTIELPGKVLREVVIPETITVQELANRMAERGVDVVKALMKLGIMAMITQSIDADTAELVVAEFGHRMKRVSESDIEIGLKGAPDPDATLLPRPPVVTVMGHVDHGKTSLLDALRETDVAAGEAGGITQHIGAYQVTLKSGARITFLDTPGHEAFTAMRARGANATDIVVLVVAADDGVMPQTVEAIDHAKAANVPIIVAINKIDKGDANPNRVRQDLLKHGLVDEQHGGEILSVEVSATKKLNLDKLEEIILLQAEVLDLKANPTRSAEGVIIESRLDRGRGPVATVLVQRGTLRVGDILVAGSEWGRVRALLDYAGRAIQEASPATPVEVIGLNATPSAGDDFAVVEDEARGREIAEFRQRRARTARATTSQRGTLEQMFSKISSGADVELAVVIKTDVQGSAEAISASAEKLGNETASVRVLHSGVGGINESDITLAKASNAVIIGFNVRANPQARELARQDNVDIRYYSIIYEVIDDLKKILTGRLRPQTRERFLGNAEILEVFTVSKSGKVAGCRVTEGQVRRGARVRLLRDSVVVHDGSLSSLRRFKDEVREVRNGLECGMAFEGYQDIKPGDVIECFEMEEVAQAL